MRVVLAERVDPRGQSRLDELAALARTMDYAVVGSIKQVKGPDPAYQLGKGKAQELASLVKESGADRVIFSNQLTPSQAFKLSKLVGREVIDRFQLILEIFEKRASSPEAKLQVEYARLSYELPRIRERVRTLLSVEQPGLMGGGEYEVQVHYDTVKRKLASLRKKLKSVERAREQKRKLRKKRGFKLVALAGYTNSGKSTLLNALTAANAEIDNMYFTTLMPRTRAIKSSQKVLLTDTVGFIDELPPLLAEAFKATLEEIYLADLAVIVVDGSDPITEIIRKYRASLKLLQDHPVKTVTAVNKTDLVPNEELQKKLEVINGMSSDLIHISALNGENLDVLVNLIRSKV